MSILFVVTINKENIHKYKIQGTLSNFYRVDFHLLIRSDFQIVFNFSLQFLQANRIYPAILFPMSNNKIEMLYKLTFLNTLLYRTFSCSFGNSTTLNFYNSFINSEIIALYGELS